MQKKKPAVEVPKAPVPQDGFSAVMPRRKPVEAPYYQELLSPEEEDLLDEAD